MSDFSNLTVTLSNTPDDSDRPSGEDIWIRLEQVGDEPDTATPTETAELVDAVFQITPCDEPPEEQEQPDPVSPEDFPAVVQDKFDMSICDKLGDHSFVVQIKVLRSDNSYPYTLRLTNGVVLKTETVSDSITEYLVINDGRSAELSHPPSTSVSLSWHLAPDSEVAITNNGSNIELSEQATGTVEAEYQSTYDLITVKCYSEGCVALAFYRGALDELELQKPDIGDPTDEEISQFCNPDETWEIEFKEGPHICHEIVHYQTLDDCDGSEVDVRTEDETIDCWEDFGPCYNESGCYHLKGSRTVTVGYTNAGTEDRVHDPDFYRQVCCEDWPFPYDMPRCQEVTSKNPGGQTLSQEDVTKYKGLYGDNTVFIPVTPKDGDCGKTVVRQRILAQNCCDMVEDLEVDKDNSVHVIADDSYGLVLFSKGKDTVTITLHGQGFYLDENHSITSASFDYTSNDKAVRIYTADACGTCIIDFSDGCSTAQYRVRSTDGHWELDEELPDCGPYELMYEADYSSVKVVEEDAIMLISTVEFKGGISTSGCTTNSCCGHCGYPPDRYIAWAYHHHGNCLNPGCVNTGLWVTGMFYGEPVGGNVSCFTRYWDYVGAQWDYFADGIWGNYYVWCPNSGIDVWPLNVNIMTTPHVQAHIRVYRWYC